MKYEVFMHVDLLGSVPVRGRQREKIMQFIYSLRDNPSILGDFTEKDASLRPRQVKIIGDYAITYWADHAVKTVMVTDIRGADR